MIGNETETRIQLKGGRSIKIIRTATPAGSVWSIPEMPEIAPHANLSVIRDRLRGKGLIASRPGEKDMMAMPLRVGAKYSIGGQLVTIKGKWKQTATGESYSAQWASAKDARDIRSGYLTMNNDGSVILRDNAGSVVSQGASGFGSASPIRASRPGKPTRFAVEDRFYFGKERFADDARQIADTILKQLGGGRFIAMTGAKNLSFASSPPGLHMSIGRGAKNGIKYLRVDYDRGSDTYTMKFLNKTGGTVREQPMVHADQLRRVFTSTTGFDTSL